MPSAVAVRPLRTQFKYAFSTARCNACADALVTAGRTRSGCEIGMGIAGAPEKGTGGRDFANNFSVLSEMRGGFAELRGEAAEKPRKHFGTIARDGTGAVAVPRNNEEGPARLPHRAAAPRVATAASLRRDMEARRARVRGTVRDRNWTAVTTAKLFSRKT